MPPVNQCFVFMELGYCPACGGRHRKHTCGKARKTPLKPEVPGAFLAEAPKEPEASQVTEATPQPEPSEGVALMGKKKTEVEKVPPKPDTATRRSEASGTGSDNRASGESRPEPKAKAER